MRLLTSMLIVAVLATNATGAVTFTEVSEQAGARFPHDQWGFVDLDGTPVQDLYGPGVAIEDLNHDGWLDLFICNGQSGNYLLLNNGDWTFSNHTDDMGIGASRVANGVAIADIDNDGMQDLVLGNFREEPELYRGGVRFGEIAEISGLVPLLPGATVLGPTPESMGAAFGDYDEDGYIDLYIANYRDQQDVLYKSLTGTYFQYDNSVDVTNQGYGFQAVFTDIDDDGDLDIFVANDFGSNFMFRNRGPAGGWGFEEVAQIWGIAGENVSVGEKSMSMGLAVGDYDNDLDMDIYITNFQLNTLWRNDGPGTRPGSWKFTDVARPLGVEYPINCWGVDFLDLDNDTDLDLIQASGYIFIAQDHRLNQPKANPNQVWINNGPDQNYSFTNVSESAGFADEMMARGLATGDLDRDGDLDILVGSNSYRDYYDTTLVDPGDYIDYPAHSLMYRNDQNDGNNWVNLRLVGQFGVTPTGRANRDAVGARVWLTTTDGVTMMREVQSGASFMSHNSLELEFGLGTAAGIERIEVRWPGHDEVEVFTGVSPNRFWRLVEGEGQGQEVPVALVSFDARSLDGGVMLEWVAAAGVPTVEVQVLRTTVDAPDAFEWIREAQVDFGPAGGQAFDPTAVAGTTYLYQIRLVGADGIALLSAPAEITAESGNLVSVRRPEVGQNFPNPFNPRTTIQFTVPREMDARLVLFDARGRAVRTLFRGVAPAGTTSVDWDGLDDRGRSVASGVYTYALVTAEGTSARRMTLVR